MTYQVWVRVLLSDAASRNRAHAVATLGPRMLRMLYDMGIPPSVEMIVKRTTEMPVEQARAKCA